MRWMIGICALFLLTALQTSVADVPGTMAYQSILLDEEGVPVTDGDYAITFRLHHDEVGGEPFWEEVQSVAVHDGILNVVLGAVYVLPIPIPGPDCWLAMQVGGESELEPRLELTSVPYSFRAAVAESLAGFDPVAGGIGGIGEPGYVPVFFDTFTVVNSLIYQEEGTISIPWPRKKLEPERKEGHSSPDRGSGTRLYVSDTDGQTIQADLQETDDLEDFRSAIFGYRTRAVPNPGAGYGVSQTNNAITGHNYWGDEHTFGIAGYCFNDFTRTGGVLGSNTFGDYWGALGYKDENSDTWGVYTPDAVYVGGSVRIGTGALGRSDDQLLVDGSINSLSGGYRFPDGTLQVTAAGGDLSLPIDARGCVPGFAFTVVNTCDVAIRGVTWAETDVAGVFGQADLGAAKGVYGRHGASGESYGYLGGVSTGAYGYTEGSHGVHGQHLNGNEGVLGGGNFGARGTHSGGNVGVLGGSSNGARGTNVNGNEGALGNDSYGVRGVAATSNSYGGFFSNTADGHHDLVLGGSVGTIDSDPDVVDSDLLLASDDDVRIILDEDGVGDVDAVFRIFKTTTSDILFTVSDESAVLRRNLVLKSETTGATILELGEGLDYAEGFDVSEKSDVRPGMVLAIDAGNPGKLAISDVSYDTKVAGIVAGANGLGSGVRLGPDEFDFDVALAGRVYCFVDASHAAVEPGDLLTTSSTPGYAMRVTDHHRARGAILGKAMESLEKGRRGQILVLVTLQ